jgi:hypothetical protein
VHDVDEAVVIIHYYNLARLGVQENMKLKEKSRILFYLFWLRLGFQAAPDIYVQALQVASRATLDKLHLRVLPLPPLPCFF